MTIDTVGTVPANIIISTVAISGTSGATLTKTGAGTLTLNVANTYTDATIVSGGTLAVGANSALVRPVLAQQSRQALH